MSADFIDGASWDLLYYIVNDNNGQLDVPSFEKKFSSLLANLQTADTVQVSKDLVDPIATLLQGSLENPGFFQQGQLAPLILVTHLAGLDQSFTGAFEKVRIFAFTTCTSTVYVHCNSHLNLPS